MKEFNTILALMNTLENLVRKHSGEDVLSNPLLLFESKRAELITKTNLYRVNDIYRETKFVSSLWQGETKATLSILRKRVRILFAELKPMNWDYRAWRFDFEMYYLRTKKDLMPFRYFYNPITAVYEVPGSEEICELRAYLKQNKVLRRIYESGKKSQAKASLAEPEIDIDIISKKETVEEASLLKGKDPQWFYHYLSENIYGQDDVKKQVAMFVYNHIHGHQRVMLIAGPSGSGKTEMFRALSKIMPKGQLIIVDGSRISRNGYSGSFHFSDLFMESRKLSRYERDHLPKEKIIVIDEADKTLFEPDIVHGVDYAQAIQTELLKLLDGDDVDFYENRSDEKTTVDGSKISWVFCGSFERTFNNISQKKRRAVGFGAPGEESSTSHEVTIDDIIKNSNMRLEIAGRIQTVCTTSSLEEEDYYRILNDENMSPAAKIGKEYGKTITLTDAVKQELAYNAKTSGLGVRYLKTQIQKMYDDAVFNGNNADFVEFSEVSLS